MGSSVIYKGMKISEEQLNRIKSMKPLNDDEIDCSDIPALTKEELSKFKPARLREKNKKSIAG